MFTFWLKAFFKIDEFMQYCSHDFFIMNTANGDQNISLLSFQVIIIIMLLCENPTHDVCVLVLKSVTGNNDLITAPLQELCGRCIPFDKTFPITP